MFGSNWPVCTLVASYPQVVDATTELIAALSTGEQDAIWGGTASRVFGIG